MESYKHKFAKDVLAGWLCTEALGGFNPVFCEYPATVDGDNHIRGMCDLWHELPLDESNPRVPTYQECLDHGLLPLVVFDVVAIHKGLVLEAYEVVHKHDVSPTKMAYVERIAAQTALNEFHVLDADWILSQVGVPKALRTIRSRYFY